MMFIKVIFIGLIFCMSNQVLASSDSKDSFNGCVSKAREGSNFGLEKSDAVNHCITNFADKISFEECSDAAKKSEAHNTRMYTMNRCIIKFAHKSTLAKCSSAARSLVFNFEKHDAVYLCIQQLDRKPSFEKCADEARNISPSSDREKTMNLCIKNLAHKVTLAKCSNTVRGMKYNGDDAMESAIGICEHHTVR